MTKGKWTRPAPPSPSEKATHGVGRGSTPTPPARPVPAAHGHDAAAGPAGQRGADAGGHSARRHDYRNGPAAPSLERLPGLSVSALHSDSIRHDPGHTRF